MKKEKKKEREQKKELIVRRISMFFIFLMIFFISYSVMASSKVSFVNINAPEDIEENTVLEIFIYAISDNNSTINYSIYKDGLLVSNNYSYTEFLDYGSSGIYDFSFVVRDNESVVIENFTITVLDQLMIASIISPVENIYTNNTINITVTTTHHNSECNYWISGIQNTTGSLSSINSEKYIFQKVVVLADGDYTIIVNCNDSFDTSSETILFSIDSAYKIIKDKSSLVLFANEVELFVNTTNLSTCRYDTQDKSYNDLTKVFLSTNNIQHTAKILGLADGQYIYYVRCKEFSGAIMGYSEIISFSIDNKPEASISLNKNPPLKAGTYDVEVKFSEAVNSVNLQYAYSNDNTLKTLPLTGSGNTYSGYLIIEKTGPDRVGYFKISAFDNNNNQGNKIVSGEIFLVDVTKPVEVQSVSVQQDNNGVILRWYYDGEQANKFNVYRSESPGVDNTDLLETTDAKNSDNEEYIFEYVDKYAYADIQYYYRVNAVDDAGNEGILSDEASILTTSENDYDAIYGPVSETIISKPLNKNLREKVDILISIIDKAIMDTELSISKINEITDPAILKIISHMKITSSISNALTNLNSLKSQALMLYEEDVGSSELDVKINKLRLDTIKVQSQVVDNIQVVESGTYEQLTQESHIIDAISSLTENLNLSKRYLDSYIFENKVLQDSVSVHNEMVSFRINYLGKEDYEKFTIITKNIIISQSNYTNDSLMIIENIPKAVAKLSDISFDKPIDIIKDDSTSNSLKFSVTEKQFILSYTINNLVDLASVKNTNSIILSKPKLSEDIANNQITGLATYEIINLASLGLLQWMVIIGIVAIIFLSSYYVKLEHPTKRLNQITKNLGINVRKIYNNNYNNNRVNGVNGNIINKSSIITPSLIRKPSTPQRTSKKFKEIVTNEQLLLSNVMKCNELINNLQYEKARTIYNQCTFMMKTVDVDDVEELHKMMYYINIKLHSYRQLHNARRYLYYRNDKALESTIKTLDKMYSDIAYHVGFMQNDIISQELIYLQFIADSKTQLEKYSIKK